MLFWCFMQKLIDFLRHLPQLMDGLTVTLDTFTDHIRSHIDHTFFSSATILTLLYYFLCDEANRNITTSKNILMLIQLVHQSHLSFLIMSILIYWGYVGRPDALIFKLFIEHFPDREPCLTYVIPFFWVVVLWTVFQGSWPDGQLYEIFGDLSWTDVEGHLWHFLLVLLPSFSPLQLIDDSCLIDWDSSMKFHTSGMLITPLHFPILIKSWIEVVLKGVGRWRPY